MPIYHLRRTATVQAFYVVQADTEEIARRAAYYSDPDHVEDMGDGEWDVYQVDRDPEPEPAFTETDARLMALGARAVDIIENEAELVHDDDSGDRSAEVKRLIRALPDSVTRARLIVFFRNEADEVFAETDDDRDTFGDPVAYAVALLPADYYTPERAR